MVETSNALESTIVTSPPAVRLATFICVPGALADDQKASNGENGPPREIYLPSGLLTHSEIRRQDIVRSVRHPVGKQHSLIFRKIAIVEDKKEFTTVRIQALNGMQDTSGEIPEIAFADVGDKALAFNIEPGDARVAVQHDRPLGSSVPVQFAYASRGQSHVDTGNRFQNWTVADCDFA